MPKNRFLRQNGGLLLLAAALILCLFLRGWVQLPWQLFTGAALAAALVFALVCLLTKKQFDAVVLFMLVGVILRIGFTLSAPVTHFQHDLGAIGTDSDGHAAYILNLLHNGTLPQSNYWQFYHPPLFHLLSAAASAILGPVGGWSTDVELMAGGQFVSCFASCASLWVFRAMAKECRLQPNTTALCMAVFACYPALVITATRINNDALVFLFMLLCLLMTVRWYRQPLSIKNTVALALCFGLGMMTKISCGLLAVITGPVMLVVWYRHIRTGKGRALFARLALFAVICFPLGLWWPLRNLILFEQPLTYVPAPGEALYCGDYTVWERLFTPQLRALLDVPFCHPFEDHNIPSYLIRCAMFGEFTWETAAWLPPVLVILSLLLTAILTIGFLVTVFRKGPFLTRFGLLLPTVLIFGSYLSINFELPFGCTMDIRYILPCIPLSLLALGAAVDGCKPRIQTAASGILACFAGVFCGSCIMLFLTYTIPA